MLGSAVKFGRVAEGSVDIYPRLAPTCEWDVAAGHAVVTAAGGKITDANGAPLHFGEGREGLHRAGIHRLGRSGGGEPLGCFIGPELYCARRLLQLRPALLWLRAERAAGSAAKASRFSSRPNR